MGGDGGQADGESDLSETIGLLEELAASEWGIGPDEFWDDRPNTATTVSLRWPLGVTVPRLHRLLTTYLERRRRELSQAAAVIAIAYNDPQKIEKRIAQIAPLLEEDEPVDPEALQKAGGFRNAALIADDDGGFVKRWWDNAEK